MGRKAVTELRTAADIERWCTRNEWKKKEGGSHTKYYGPGGKSIAVVPRRAGDLRRGTLRSIIKILLLGCLAVAVVCIFL